MIAAVTPNSFTLFVNKIVAIPTAKQRPSEKKVAELIEAKIHNNEAIIQLAALLHGLFSCLTFFQNILYTILKNLRFSVWVWS